MAVGEERMAGSALRRCGLFGSADDDAIETLIHVLKVRKFRRGETIFHQGDPGDALFVVDKGSVKVVLPSDEGAEPAIVAILGPGEFFGELAILDGAPRSATIRSKTDVKIAVLGIRMFRTLLREVPDLAEQLLVGLAGELRNAQARVAAAASA